MREPPCSQDCPRRRRRNLTPRPASFLSGTQCLSPMQRHCPPDSSLPIFCVCVVLCICHFFPSLRKILSTFKVQLSHEVFFWCPQAVSTSRSRLPEHAVQISFYAFILRYLNYLFTYMSSRKGGELPKQGLYFIHLCFPRIQPSA